MVDPQTDQPVGPDLSTCDREPIHIPGSIQPHGVLLVLAEPELTLVQASANAGDVLGQPPGALLGQPLDALLHPEGVAVVRGGLANPSLERTPLYLGALCVTRDGAEHGYDVIAHRIAGLLVVELEAAETGGAVSFQSLYPLVRSFVSQLERVTRWGSSAVWRRRKSAGSPASTACSSTGSTRAGTGRWSPRTGTRSFLVPGPALSGVGHPPAGAGAVPGEPPAPHPGRRLHARPTGRRGGRALR
jgi:hypothetical protein